MIDGLDNSTATIPAGSGPGAIAVNPVTNKIYVSNANSRDVTVINGSDNSTVTISTVVEPGALAVNVVTNRIYVALPKGNFVLVMDGKNNSWSGVPVDGLPVAIAINSLTNRIYIANFDRNHVTAINGTDNSTETIAVGASPRSIAINPLTNKIYVGNFSDSSVTVIDGHDNSSVVVAPGFKPYSIAVNCATNKIYVANQNNGIATIIDGTNNSTSIAMAGQSPHIVSINPITNSIYALSQAGAVTMITPSQTQSLPLNTSVTPLEENTTGSAVPRFTFTATSAYSPFAAPPRNIYFQVDTRNGVWTRAINIGSTATTLTARASTGTLQQGLHMIYFFASDGSDATTSNSLTGGRGTLLSGVIAPESPQIASPVIGGINAYQFLVKPIPTAADVSISGRVLMPNGGGLRNARVRLTDSQGVSRTAISTSLGYYRFDNVRAGDAYVVNVSSKSYQFTPRLINVFDDLTSVDFIADPGLAH